MASTDAFPVPRKNVAYRVTFPILDADGDPVTGATGLDSEVSKDGAQFADCTNEATEITAAAGSISGMYYLDLTATEMNADTVAIGVHTTTSGAKTTMIVIYPEEIGDYRVNVSQFGGTTVTGRDIGASVLLSTGTGTGQLDFTSGVVKANLAQILGTALTETAGQIAGAFKKFFDKATPTGTINSIPDAVAGATGGLFIAGTNAATTVTTALTTTFTGNLTGSVGSVTGLTASNLDATVSSRATPAQVTTAVWDEDATTHQTAGTFGKAIGDPLTATNSLIQRTPDAVAGAAGGLFIAGTNAATSITTGLTTTFTGNLTGSVGSVTGLTVSNLDATVSSRATPAQVTTAVWDEDATGHQTQGTFGHTIGDQVADADSIWSLANTNLDATVSSRAAASDLATVQADTDNIQTRLPAALESGRIAAALDATGVDAILDDAIEGSMTLRQAMRIVLAACANKLSGAATTTVTIRDLADTKARITATVDADGNRSAVTLDAT